MPGFRVTITVFLPWNAVPVSVFSNFPPVFRSSVKLWIDAASVIANEYLPAFSVVTFFGDVAPAGEASPVGFDEFGAGVLVGLAVLGDGGSFPHDSHTYSFASVSHQIRVRALGGFL